MWIDGVLVGTDTSTRVNNFNEKPFYLGRETGGTGYKCYGGNLDEFAVWEGDMSGDVATIYNSGTPTDLTSLSPVAWYRMGDKVTSWATIPDQIGSNDGTAYNEIESVMVVTDTP